MAAQRGGHTARLASTVEIRYYARSFCQPPANKEVNLMANSAQARKRARQAESTRKRNASLKSTLRSAIKKVKKAIAVGDKVAATKELQSQQSTIDRIADKKIVHKNAASRTKMRLAQAIKALA
jgi:small subunit ribosomal protein S20